MDDRRTLETEILQNLVNGLRAVEDPLRRQLGSAVEHMPMHELARAKGQLEAYAGIRTDLERRLGLLKPASPNGTLGLFDEALVTPEHG